MRMTRVMAAALCATGLPVISSTAARAEPVPAQDRLTVTVDDGAGHVATYELHCHPAGGTHPEAQAACDRLDELGGPVGPPPPGQMCTMLYGGPQKAVVFGTWHGAAVGTRYDRSNGCETARWRDMAPVLSTAAMAEW